MKKVAVDFDGFLTTASVKCRSWIPDRLYQVVLVLYKPKPKFTNILRIQRWRKAGKKIIIISARPELTRGVTKDWLKENNVLVDELVLVGTNDIKSEKWKALKRREINYYYGNNFDTIIFLLKKGINAFLN